jgi:hypothetical protein
MNEVSKLRFEFKEVAYIVAAAIAYFTQLSILSNKIESYKNFKKFISHKINIW